MRKRVEHHFTPLEFEILMSAYADYEHIFRHSSNTAASTKERQLAWKKVAGQVSVS